MRRLILLALTLWGLAGCAPEMTGYRRSDAPITAMVGFDPARFAGNWHEVAAIGRPSGGRWRVVVAPDGTLDVTTSRDGAGRGRMIAAGRFRLSNLSAPLWVLWADGNMRSVVLGTPDGSFAFVLDRKAQIPPDRMRAAREILNWNGYDTGALG